MIYDYDWQDLAFGSKKPLSSLKATFIAPPREISKARFTELVKEYLPTGNIVVGIAKEQYIDGFAGQPQFKTLRPTAIRTVIDKVNSSASKHKIYTLTIAQRDVIYAVEKLKFNQAVFVNGSWQYAFHTRDLFYTLVQQKLPYVLVSPFTNETEAKTYEKTHSEKITFKHSPFDDHDMLGMAEAASTLSYDYVFQTGAVLGKKVRGKYKYQAHAFNKVVPFQGYAMLNGSARERNFSPPNDLNHYDTVHAETALLVGALKKKIDLKGSSLFINLLPCPTCARMLAITDISEVVYSIDHSDGYAVALLEKAGKSVRRVV